MASKIVLVEDDATIASGLIYAFEKEDYLAQHCKDMKSALTAINKEHFDLAILDMQLPYKEKNQTNEAGCKYGSAACMGEYSQK